MTEQFKFTSKDKMFAIGLSVIGLILVIISVIIGPNYSRFWGSFLVANWYFLVLGLGGMVILAVNTLAQAGWNAALRRVPEAMSTYAPIGWILMFLVVFASHSLYHWTHEDLDPVLQGKSGYLNMPFFTIRMLLIGIIWTFFIWMFRRNSLKEDEIGGIDYFNKSVKLSAFFMILFGISFSFASWDWLMSLEPHWYSTMYAVYTFAGLFVGGWTVMTLLTIFLKGRGYFQYINANHFHDLGKFMFGFSIFWTYIWVGQFLLIWYANIPEETMHFYTRMEGSWETLFFGNLILNFVIPFFGLMTNDNKRNPKVLLLVGLSILVGRYVDVYLLVMPGAMGHGTLPTFGLPEIGFLLLIAGLYIYTIFYSLSKASLYPKNHPYIEESLHHDVLKV